MKKTTAIAGILGVTALISLSTIVNAEPHITSVETTVEKAVEHADHAPAHTDHDATVEHETHAETTVTVDDEIHADVDADTEVEITTDEENEDLND